MGNLERLDGVDILCLFHSEHGLLLRVCLYII